MNINLKKIKQAVECSDLNWLEQNKSKINWNVIVTDDDKDSLILYALGIDCQNIEVCNLILLNGGNIFDLNVEGESAVHSIVYSGRFEKLIEFKDKYHLDINKKSSNGTSPLLLAILLEKYDIIEVLLTFKDIDINNYDNEMNGPLHMASYFGMDAIVKQLVEKGADLFSKTNKGNLAISLALNNGHYNVAKFLFKSMF